MSEFFRDMKTKRPEGYKEIQRMKKLWGAEKMTCSCGAKITNNHYYEHRKTKKHKDVVGNVLQPHPNPMKYDFLFDRDSGVYLYDTT